MKKIICLTLAICLALGMVPAAAFAKTIKPTNEKTFAVGDKVYALTDGAYYNDNFVVADEPSYIHYYYSDGFFEGKSTDYNEHLATLSLNFGMAYGDARRNEDRIFRHDVIRRNLANIGCSDQSIYVNDEALSETSKDTVGVIIANKKLQLNDGTPTGFTLVPIVLRGANYYLEWLNNFTLGSKGESQGFSEAANKVFAEVKAYLKNNRLEEIANEGKVKFWICGYSRGACIANLLAKRMVEVFGTESVYAYNWEAPLAGQKSEIKKGVDYSCIHNQANYADLIRMLPPSSESFEFINYGETKFYPSSKESEYNSQKPLMLKQLQLISPNNYYDDSFEVAALNISFENNRIALGKTNHVATGSLNKELGDWLKCAVSRLIEWGIPSRTKYANSIYKLNGKEYTTQEEAVRRLLKVLFTPDKEHHDMMFDRIKNGILKELKAQDLLMIVDIISNWNSSGEYKITDERKIAYSETLWKKIVATGAFDEDIQDPKDVESLKAVWPVLVDTIFNIIYNDLHTEANEYAEEYGLDDVKDKAIIICTIIKNGKKLIYNHDPYVNLAWARAEDSLYTNETERGKPEIVRGVERIKANANGKTLSTKELDPTEIAIGSVAFLDVPSRKGEIIIYQVDDLLNKKDQPKDTLYKGGIKIPAKPSAYKITCYARYEMVNSAPTSFYITTK